MSRWIAMSAALAVMLLATSAAAYESDELGPDGLAGSGPKSSASLNSRGFRSRLGQGHANSGTTQLDTLLNWNGHYRANGVDSNGQSQVIWYYNMVGNRPQLGGTTTINAPVIPVSVDLRNADGTPRFVNGHRLFSDATQYIPLILNSPVFQNASYTSSPVPTQFTDAVQRAEFAHSAKDDWHTLLRPSVKTPRVMTLLRGTYQFMLNPDGTCCAFILVEENAFINALFPPTFGHPGTPIGDAQAAGEMTQRDLSNFIFPNTFLFGSFGCCVLGFHSFDFEPIGNIGLGQAFVMTYSSWISPGLFGSAFADITALSHEIAETYNDPLVAFDGVNNITPWWLAPNGNCQNNLETGDVVEGLPNATFPMTMNGFTYHPQNEALLQWFEFESPSSALGGAYSYPNTSVLTSPSAPQNVGCQ